MAYLLPLNIEKIHIIFCSNLKIIHKLDRELDYEEDILNESKDYGVFIKNKKEYSKSYDTYVDLINHELKYNFLYCLINNIKNEKYNKFHVVDDIYMLLNMNNSYYLYIMGAILYKEYSIDPDASYFLKKSVELKNLLTINYCLKNKIFKDDKIKILIKYNDDNFFKYKDFLLKTQDKLFYLKEQNESKESNDSDDSNEPDKLTGKKRDRYESDVAEHESRKIQRTGITLTGI